MRLVTPFRAGHGVLDYTTASSLRQQGAPPGPWKEEWVAGTGEAEPGPQIRDIVEKREVIAQFVTIRDPFPQEGRRGSQSRSRPPGCSALDKLQRALAQVDKQLGQRFEQRRPTCDPMADTSEACEWKTQLRVDVKRSDAGRVCH